MNSLQNKPKLIALAVVLFAFAVPASLVPSALAKGLEAKDSKTKASEKARQTKSQKNAREQQVSKAGQASNQRESNASRRADGTRRELSAKASPKNISRTSTKGLPPRSDDTATKAQSGSNRLARDSRANAAASKRRQEELRRAELRRAESARLAAIARECSADESLRDDVQALIAKDDLTGEDPEIRGIAVNALGNRAGTVVVMDPKTGRVYSMVNQEWAVREGFKPCSTIKLVTGLAGLNEQVIDAGDTTKISDSNNMSLTRALAYSKNEYFQHVGGQVGFEKMLSYARQLGLGEKTGINVRNEFAGRMPNAKALPGIARMSSHGDDFQVTALQLATLVSAMSNGGKLVAPYVVRSRQDELKFRTKVRRQIKLDSEVWRNMIPGMIGAVNYGSGKKAQDPRQTVAGKTGTCIERGGWVGLFTSYAPVSNPRLTVVVIARGADARNHFPAAVAGRIYRDLSVRFGTPSNLQVATTRRSSVPVKSEADDEEGSEATALRRFSNEDRNLMGNRTPLVSSKSPTANANVKPVLMQIPKRTESIKPQTETNDTPASGADGQTRPRRVYSE
ncbi:MAG TPA: penicillin-binding transpeptidase domain-containing protein [Pyrinomonadaceae bacterium]|nr:penicillin-binding transpeptidase domain-containing protein [Pyrinomonadaceae bacterium]